jgi:probable rRNA maturation factor
VNLFLADEQDEPLQPDALLRLAEIVMERAGLPEDTEASIVLVGADQIAEYNDRFLGRTGPTDVISLPIEDLAPGAAPRRDPGGPPLNLGDVFICPEVVRSNAAGAGVPFEAEMALMVVHGFLHLLGWDHQDPGDAERMEQRERELLAEVGVERP